MKEHVLEQIRCPQCHARLKIKSSEMRLGEIHSGTLECEGGAHEFPIHNYIPRLVDTHNYSDSWGDLWRNTGEVIRDSYTGETFYRDVIFGKCAEDPNAPGLSSFGFEWPEKLDGQNVLEIGPGVGVCTEHLVHTGARILSVDMSNAVDSFPESLLTHPNLNVVQADITSGAVVEDQFDRIWFFQVLQHTPSPPDTLKSVKKLLKPGGQLSVTSYRASYYPWFHFLTKRLNFRQVYHLVKIFVPIRYHLRKACQRIHFRFGERLARKALEFSDPRDLYYQTLEGTGYTYLAGRLYQKHHDKNELMKLTIINAHDAITPEYTNGATHEELKSWLESAGYRDIEMFGYLGAYAKAAR